MATRRTYGDSCGIARALDLVGERWALLVARELLLGPKRFTDLRSGLPNVGPDVLAQRLRELEGSGIIRRSQMPPPAASRVYELTEWGRELEPVLLALGRWGSRAPLADQPPPLGVDAIVIALETTFDPEVGTPEGAAAESYELVLGEQVFALQTAGAGFDARRGRVAAPRAAIATDPGTLADVLWHGRPLGSAIADGSMRIEGDHDGVRALLRRFPAPVAAEAAA
jgi:DNA-binding HxlR family transcriptional regulator